MPTLLFREEAIHTARSRLDGAVSIVTPVSWQITGLVLAVLLSCGAVATSAVSYARVEQVVGTIVLDTGVLEVGAKRSGVLFGLSVKEGSIVKSGEIVAVIQAEEDVAGDRSVSKRVRASLTEQDENLALEIRMRTEAANADFQRISKDIDAARQKITALSAQVTSQRRLVELAEADFQTATEIAKKGYVSRRDLESREVQIISRRQQLSELEQAITAARFEVASAKLVQAEIASSASATTAALTAQRQSLSQNAANLDLTPGYVLRAPQSGMITAVSARTGQQLSQGDRILSIVPDKSKTQVELLLPSAAIGAVKRGEQVKIAVDAFPKDRFGVISGTISEVARAAISQDDKLWFLVRVQIEKPYIKRGSDQYALLPGMSVSAQIAAERHYLIDWLLRPFRSSF